jgi:HPt (histidine-containing phosphotransfer) domain-containing protein
MTRKRADITVEAFADHEVISQPNPLRAALRRLDAKAETVAADDAVARAEAALAQLSDEFGQWMAEECERLSQAHAALLLDGACEVARDELFHAAHDIKGDAATFGFPAAAAVADSLCRLIEHAPDFARVPDELIANHVNAIQAIVREGADDGKSKLARALNVKLRSVADDYLAAVNRDRPEHLEAILAPRLVPDA